MSKKYHFWISGCQMNYADARQVATGLEQLGYRPTLEADDANVIILQTCTVRQQAEDKAFGRLQSLRPLKEEKPDLTLAMMGCIVGVKGNESLEKKFPFVDVWMPPATDGRPLISHLLQNDDFLSDAVDTNQRHAVQDEDIVLSQSMKANQVSAPVAVVYGCSHACSFCIIPNRRGIERTRAVGDIVAEVRTLVSQGVREVVLLGQIVDRYGKDVPDGPDLADLLRVVHNIDGLSRIRFLTSHPNYMTNEILSAVAELPKVMPQIEVPIQAGDDAILERMKRGYTVQQYRELTHRIRDIVPGASIHNDIIVGFPGESRQQFQGTYDLIKELEFDKVHIARYSPRTGTVSARKMVDDVPDEEKRYRFHALESLQKSISIKKTRQWLDKNVEVLVEDKHKGRWRGRTPQGKLVFLDDDRDLRGEMVDVHISYTGPWSMSGEAIDKKTQPQQLGQSIPLTII
jgi:tRNA-2-methylthio-N6-dimethylallyladenosine synthase